MDWRAQDRTNLGNAQTDNFNKDIGITLDQINVGQTLFTLGIVLLELPSNVIAKRFGPNRWIPTIMVIWGLVTLCQAFVTGLGGFYATRFLLAAGEVSRRLKYSHSYFVLLWSTLTKCVRWL
jgi:MFS family permease